MFGRPRAILGVLILEIINTLMGGLLIAALRETLSNILRYGFDFYRPSVWLSILLIPVWIGALISILAIWRRDTYARKFYIVHSVIKLAMMAWMMYLAYMNAASIAWVFALVALINLYSGYTIWRTKDYFEGPTETIVEVTYKPQEPVAQPATTVETPPQIDTPPPTPSGPTQKLGDPPQVESKSISCPNCGSKNPQDNRFCGSCGKRLYDAPVTQTPPTPKPRAEEPPPRDPMDSHLAPYRGEATWEVVLGNKERDMGAKKIYNMWWQDIRLTGAEVDKFQSSMLSNKVDLLPGIRRVIIPNGQATTGGYVLISAGFRRGGNISFRGKRINVLILGRDEGYARLCAVSERGFTEEQFREFMSVVTESPRSVEDLSVWLAPEPSRG